MRRSSSESALKHYNNPTDAQHPLASEIEQSQCKRQASDQRLWGINKSSKNAPCAQHDLSISTAKNTGRTSESALRIPGSDGKSRIVTAFAKPMVQSQNHNAFRGCDSPLSGLSSFSQPVQLPSLSEDSDQGCSGNNDWLRTGGALPLDESHESNFLERSGSCELDQFDTDERNGVTRIAPGLSCAFSPKLGISQRKILLTSLAEELSARETQQIGFSINTFQIGGMDNFASRSFSSSLTEISINSGASSQDSIGSELEGESALQWKRADSAPPSTNPLSIFTGPEGYDLLVRLSRARQTVSFVKRQAEKYSSLGKAQMDIWAALDMLSQVKDASIMENRDLDPTMNLLERSYRVAEAFRIAYPHDDWLHLLGLIHLLGHLLVHPSIGGEPLWAVCGESFPVGCQFDSHISFHDMFSVNPDRRSKRFSSPTGIYTQGGGLAAVYMSWSASEYLYMLLLLNKTLLPPQALFILRYHKFYSLEKSKAYTSLMSRSDKRYASWLPKFRSVLDNAKPGQEMLTGDSFRSYYSELLRKYIPKSVLKF